MLKKVISGGQCGVDIVALRVAKRHGLETGGYMPGGWRTLEGPRPQYQAEYGLEEHVDYAYTGRTYANVRHADGTLRLFLVESSPGERCTLQAIRHFQKPHFDVDLSNPTGVETAVVWLIQRRIVTLNVAGNSTFTAPEIEPLAEAYLTALFTMLRETSCTEERSG